MNRPKTSVLIASFNMGEFVGEAIDSCLKNLQDCEVIVVNDGSTDNTDAVMNIYKDNRAVVYKSFLNNRGKVAAYNEAFSLSRGDIIMLLGADDAIMPGRKTMVEFCENLVGPAFVVGSYYITDEVLHPVSRKCPLKSSWPKVLQGNPYPGGAAVFNRSYAARVFPINEKSRNEDYLLSVIACKLECDYVCSEDVLLYRRHSGNTWSGADPLRDLLGEMKRTSRIMALVSEFQEFSKYDREMLYISIKARRLVLCQNFYHRLIYIPLLAYHGYSSKWILRALLGVEGYIKMKVILKKISHLSVRWIS
jgi:glycosyltransferase involved in cell wall biosynthesis